MDFSQEKHPAGSVWNLLLFQKFYDFDVYFEPIIERFPAFEKSAQSTHQKHFDRHDKTDFDNKQSP
jgi:hypothetical protein